MKISAQTLHELCSSLCCYKVVLQSSPTYSPNTKMNILGGNSVLHKSLCFARFSVAFSAVHEPEIKETGLIFILQASVRHKTQNTFNFPQLRIPNQQCMWGVSMCVCWDGAGRQIQSQR